MLSKALLIVNYNLYEFKRHFIQKLAEALNLRGIKPIIYDVQKNNYPPEVFSRLVQDFAPDFACSFNSAGQNINNKYWWEAFSLPYVSFLLDPVPYSLDLLTTPYSILTSVDRQDCVALQAKGFQNIFFWPHAVEKELAADEPAERPYEVVFMGTCSDYENTRLDWQAKLPLPVCKALEDAIDRVFSDDTIGLDRALEQAWDAANLTRNRDEEVVKNYCLSFFYLDRYTRGKDRIELIRSIKNAQVHIFGRLEPSIQGGKLDWKDYLGSQPNVTIHAPVGFEKALQIFKQSKIVLNSMPFFRDGSHERVFIALACGCLPVSSESKYLREEFSADEEIVFYQAARRSEVSDKIDVWLSNESKRKSAVAQGRMKVMRRHTWNNRVETLLQVLPPLIAKLKKT